MTTVFQVLVQGIEGDVKPIDVANSEAEFNSMSIDTFMTMVATKLLKNPGISNFTLVYANLQLERGKKFLDYHIRNKCTMVMITQLPGGR